MKAMFGVFLLVFSVTAFAGGDTKTKGAPDDTWLGDSNDDEYFERSLVVKCPVNTTAGSIEAVVEEDSVAMIVVCNYDQ